MTTIRRIIALPFAIMTGVLILLLVACAGITDIIAGGE